MGRANDRQHPEYGYGVDDGPTMAPGKRLSTDDPLTEHDIAERLDKAVLRVLRIMIDARNLETMPQVKSSRYLTNSVNLLAAELKEWGIDA